MDDKFVSTIPSNSFDSALLGGLDFVKTKPDIEKLKEDVAAITPDDTAVDGKPWTSKNRRYPVPVHRGNRKSGAVLSCGTLSAGRKGTD